MRALERSRSAFRGPVRIERLFEPALKRVALCTILLLAPLRTRKRLLCLLQGGSAHLRLAVGEIVQGQLELPDVGKRSGASRLGGTARALGRGERLVTSLELGAALVELLRKFSDRGFELALGGDDASRDGHRSHAVGMIGQRDPVEECRVPVAGRSRNVAFDRRGRALNNREGECPPPVVLFRWDPTGEVPPERLRRGPASQQHEGAIVGREHRPVCPHTHQAAGLDVQQASKMDDLHRRIGFLAVHCRHRSGLSH